MSKHIFPEFALAVIAGKSSIQFSSEGFYRFQKLALAEVAHPFSWNGRRAFDESIVEFYQLELIAGFNRFLAEVRQAFFLEINRILATLCGEHNVVASKLVVKGLPTVEQIDLAIQELRTGGKAFGEIYKSFSY